MALRAIFIIEFILSVYIGRDIHSMMQPYEDGNSLCSTQPLLTEGQEEACHPIDLLVGLDTTLHKGL